MSAIPKRLAAVYMERCIGCYSCMLACSRYRMRSLSLEKSAIQIRTAGGIERGFIAVVCRACVDPPCAKVCEPKALKPRKGGGVIFNPKLCTGCGKCVEACIIGAVVWDEERRMPIICTHCGLCVDFCPHGILRLEPVEKEVIW